jgi:ATP-binding protein involved in chromosome partitioning
MSEVSRQQVEEALAEVHYPGFTRSIVSFGLIQEIRVADNGDVAVILEHNIADAGVVERIRRDVQSALDGLSGVARADLAIRHKGQEQGQAQAQPAPAAPAGVPPAVGIPGVQHIVAVASAKGGVGKSTVATNLALALRDRGSKVGLLDADIYGPSIPTMFDLKESPTITDDRKILPVEKEGLKLISIGLLVPPEKALIWRGPMVMGAVQQLLNDVEWGELDVLVVDLPPGTGDAQLTLVQQVPLSAVVMVTTPQPVALVDVVRGVQMFEQTNVPIAGLIENMNGFVCPCCGEETEIFGKGGGEEMALRYGVPYLSGIPIDPRVRLGGDGGRPVLLDHPDSPATVAFHRTAERLSEFLDRSASSAAAAQ